MLGWKWYDEIVFIWLQKTWIAESQKGNVLKIKCPPPQRITFGLLCSNEWYVKGRKINEKSEDSYEADIFLTIFLIYKYFTSILLNFQHISDICMIFFSWKHKAMCMSQSRCHKFSSSLYFRAKYKIIFSQLSVWKENTGQLFLSSIQQLLNDGFFNLSYSYCGATFQEPHDCIMYDTATKLLNFKDKM